MKILLSPAKTLDYETELPTATHTQPLFPKEAKKLNGVLKKMSKKSVGELMHISDALAGLNYQRYKEFQKDFNPENSRPAVYAFAGDVYTGLDAYTISNKHEQALQDKVRILSGMYGYLRPLDLLQPYRLEMGTKLPVGNHKNLYEFWKDKVTPSLNKEIEVDELVVNLASNEYFKVIDKKKLKGELITPVFKDYKNGKLKVISFFAKKARGTMARFLVENNASNLQDLIAFQEDDYRFSSADTENENEPVFIR
ncbi:MAG: peroxide stress protein YaaA [Nonlabens sp.]|uniref:peroxide stress protein YaaA n=1 Tax=Nonlabens sp. TaxID=1888209 RepID=UPI003EF41A9C